MILGRIHLCPLFFLRAKTGLCYNYTTMPQETTEARAYLNEAYIQYPVGGRGRSGGIMILASGYEKY